MKSINRLWIVLAAVFVFVQTASIIHDSEHSDHPHEHECVMCEVHVLQEDDFVVSRSSYIFVFADFIFLENPVSEPDINAIRWPYERASRGRGPPSDLV
ncbi:hypothetical protein [Hirschia maritima]|uniref:hypothetical protein n=1 Tax=Hirschia maritima TaxID=1121961 RepID=UPI0012DEAE49|nr:hypothetical protein [Hirschia maritima]